MPYTPGQRGQLSRTRLRNVTARLPVIPRSEGNSFGPAKLLRPKLRNSSQWKSSLIFGSLRAPASMWSCELLATEQKEGKLHPDILGMSAPEPLSWEFRVAPAAFLTPPTCKRRAPSCVY